MQLELTPAPREARDWRGHFIKQAIPAAVRREIAQRHGCTRGSSARANCAYCGAVGSIFWFTQPTDRGLGWVAFKDLEMDHRHPEILGGTTDASNIVLACRPCNRSKGARTKWRPS